MRMSTALTLMMMIVRNVCPSVFKYVCFCIFCVPFAFPLFRLFNARVFCSRHFLYWALDG